MIISMVSPYTSNMGNSVSSILLAHGLADLKRKVLLTHIKPQSYSYEQYLGLKAFEDKTSTPSQLVKLMREGAIKAEEIGDYCKNVYDFLDVFTNTSTNFSEQDMSTLHEFLVTSDSAYDYQLFDIDADYDSESSQKVISKSNIIILNITSSFLEIEKFNREKEKIIKMCKGKKVILLCSAYDSKSAKLKDIVKALGVNTSCYVIRHNSYVKWACNQGKLGFLYKQGKTKNADVLDVFKDVTSLAVAVSRAKIAVGRGNKGVFKA